MMAHLRNDILLKKVGKKIKRLREEHNLTQEEFYNDTGIHLGRIETASHNISLSTLDSICKYFSVTISQFFEDI
jgi:transcriptional regulator with XRE-family HTH domain